MLRFVLALTVASALGISTWAWNKADDIPVENLPAAVSSVLEKYVQILKESPSVDEAAAAFAQIAGGSLVNDNGSVSNNTRQFGLKKDFNNLKHLWH